MTAPRRQVDLRFLFACEPCAVSLALINGHDCLCKGNKSGLVERLGVVEILPKDAVTVFIGVS